ncbi:DUF503 domain-containing protein [Amnibacterium endophyticum]|uniref:DUF503 domain-containing protein n=1 Tax=Amnibacterium endophyticum TaxID=2109337 RepID=A0ABW4LF74_9MICO
MWIGWIEFDFLLGDVHSLKQKRAIVKPIVTELWRHHPVAAAEVGDQDLHRRARVGISAVFADPARLTEVLDRAERAMAERPEVQLLSARRRIVSSDD